VGCSYSIFLQIDWISDPLTAPVPFPPSYKDRPLCRPLHGGQATAASDRRSRRALERLDSPLPLVLVGGHPGEWGRASARHRPQAREPAGLAGWHAHEELAQALNASDLLVLPSVGEAFGLVLVEATACGLPVIACRTHGPAEIVADGKTGWLIPPDDEDSLTDALIAAATDQQERMARGWRAQAESHHHGWPATIHRLTLLYDELAALAPRRHTAREQRS
jgi:glycosyltransferase involved in cell wall biosynthesis